MQGDRILNWVNELLTSMGIRPETAGWLDQILIFALIAILAVALGLFCRYVITGIVQRVVRYTSVDWDDTLLNTKLLRKLFRSLPVMLIKVLLPLAFENSESGTLALLERLLDIILIWTFTAFLNELLKTVFNLFESRNTMQGRPLKGVMQILQIALYLIAVILILSVILDKQPRGLLTGLGVSATLLMLIFKDSIVGLVSGVQLSANDMLKAGDWITMPKYGADGTVIDVTLNTVKVRNFDNTITTIPPYALTSDSFQNWRGMEESPGRRIKRAINIDMNSVKFCTPEMLEKYRTISLITKYIDSKEEELARFNAQHHIDNLVTINARRQTNIGVFRVYLTKYLENLPQINHDMTCIVRQLQPTENGIPIELYCFSKVKEWAGYEQVQSDIFDHVMSVVPEFGLRVYQTPSGHDMRVFTRLATGCEPVDTKRQ